MHTIFRICGNESWPGLQLVEKLAMHLNRDLTQFICRVFLESLKSSKSKKGSARRVTTKTNNHNLKQFQTIKLQ